jgi:hypothetical protein
MGEDFPAAHSMDTEWFAVDRDGQVALFFTGENGPLPAGAAAADLGEALRALGGSAEAVEALHDSFEDAILEFARLGIHVYDDASDWFSGPYVRVHRPERPLHVDQLPPQLRAQVKAVRFDDLRFTDKDDLQPCDHTECDAWPSGYLSDDGKTARPLPGQEPEFRQAMERFRQEYPDVYRQFRIEGLDEGA